MRKQSCSQNNPLKSKDNYQNNLQNRVVITGLIIISNHFIKFKEGSGSLVN